MPTYGGEDLRWRTSSRSTGDGVEVAVSPVAVAIRNSTAPNGPILRFDTETWRGFVGSIRAGAFDLPPTD